MAVYQHIVIPASRKNSMTRFVKKWDGSRSLRSAGSLIDLVGGQDCTHRRLGKRAFNQFGEQRLAPGMAKVGVRPAAGDFPFRS
jgi:hypothetical protein